MGTLQYDHQPSWPVPVLIHSIKNGRRQGKAAPNRKARSECPLHGRAAAGPGVSPLPSPTAFPLHPPLQQTCLHFLLPHFPNISLRPEGIQNKPQPRGHLGLSQGSKALFSTVSSPWASNLPSEGATCSQALTTASVWQLWLLSLRPASWVPAGLCTYVTHMLPPLGLSQHCKTIYTVKHEQTQAPGG